MIKFRDVCDRWIKYPVKIPEDALIPDSKLTQYLLVFREQDDKSKFLAQAGFTLDNAEALKSAPHKLITDVEAEEDEDNAYGIFVWLGVI